MALGKLADCIVLVSSATQVVDAFGEACIAALCAQCMPSTFHVVHSLTSIPAKLHASTKRSVVKKLESMVVAKVFFIDSINDAKTFLWPLVNLTPKEIRWRELRAHMLVNSHVFLETPVPAIADGAAAIVDGKPILGTLCLTGYIRGRAWYCNMQAI